MHGIVHSEALTWQFTKQTEVSQNLKLRYGLLCRMTSPAGRSGSSKPQACPGTFEVG